MINAVEKETKKCRNMTVERKKRERGEGRKYHARLAG
jgi:hypothetical protein